jgi:hypothetical protein
MLSFSPRLCQFISPQLRLKTTTTTTIIICESGLPLPPLYSWAMVRTLGGIVDYSRYRTQHTPLATAAMVVAAVLIAGESIVLPVWLLPVRRVLLVPMLLLLPVRRVH